MATKTFEELKQLAIQIRDEKTNKQNTATRIGTQMLEHLNKLEQDYYDKTATDEELKQRDEKLTELESSTLYNLNINKNDIPIIKGYTPFSSGENIGTIGAQPDFSCTPLIYVKHGDVLMVSGATINKCHYWNSFVINKDTYIEGENTTIVPPNAVVACISFFNASNSNYENLKIDIPNEIVGYDDLLDKSIVTQAINIDSFEQGKEYIIQDDAVVSNNNEEKKSKTVLCDNAIGLSFGNVKIYFSYINIKL